MNFKSIQWLLRKLQTDYQTNGSKIQFTWHFLTFWIQHLRGISLISNYSNLNYKESGYISHFQGFTTKMRKFYGFFQNKKSFLKGFSSKQELSTYKNKVYKNFFTKLKYSLSTNSQLSACNFMFLFIFFQTPRELDLPFLVHHEKFLRPINDHQYVKK